MDSTPAIQNVLNEIGIKGPSTRTILIQNRYFVGCKFCFDGGYAIHAAEKNMIEVYDDAGTLVRTVAVDPAKKNRSA